MDLTTDTAIAVKRPFGVALARLVTVSVACAAIGWAAFVVPTLLQQASIAPIAVKIIAGEEFKPETLAHYVENVAPDTQRRYCRPVVWRAFAIVRLRLAEAAIVEGERGMIDKTQSDLKSAISRALACTPTDSFLWFAMFWLQNSMVGLNDHNLKSLRMSYLVGPNEGWVSLRRNRIAIAVYPQLSEDLQYRAVDEFVQLVKSDFITAAADVLAGPGRPMRDALIKRLQGVDDQKLRFLSTLLAGKGIDDVIPSLDTSSQRSPR